MLFSRSCFPLLVGLLLLGGLSVRAGEKPNVLFIAVDDLRPQLGCYGIEKMHSPNIDALARRGVLFERSYCMVPTCGASRASLLTGLRPTRSRFVNYLTWAERDAKGVLPLHTHFQNNGYTTVSLGKIFHHPEDHANGWSTPPWRPRVKGYQNEKLQQRAIAEHKRKYPNRRRYRGTAVESFEAPDDRYPDGQIALRAIEQLQRFSRNATTSPGETEPFFLAVGFLKPHLPFVAPQKYFDLYDAEDITLPENSTAPQGAPPESLHRSGELRSYAGIPPKGPVDEETARRLIHGYYACVSFTDAQIGRLLAALDRFELTENTIVVLWGDHGWNLLEHGLWNKHCCYETSMHAPLIITAPQAEGVEPGTRVKALTEFIDIYPTLCDLGGLPKPKHLEGQTLLPLMIDPETATDPTPWAIGRYGPGDTIRTDGFRFTEFTNPRGSRTGRMLYDHDRDPRETVNIVERDAVEQETERLTDLLRAHKGTSR